DFDVGRLRDDGRAKVYEIIRESLGIDASDQWFQWKHEDGPWGPSRIWVARDEEGVLGAICSLPWGIRFGERLIRASRLVDGGTASRAQRRGVFGTLVAEELLEVARSETPLSFCTATPDAERSHRRNGAVAFRVDHRYGVARPR